MSDIYDINTCPHYEVQISLRFRSGHRLITPYSGKCNHVHGEGYTLIAIFKTISLDNRGMIYDFGDVKKTIKEWIDNNLDHAYIHHDADMVGTILRDGGFRTYSIGAINPTAENIAKMMYDVIKNKLGLTSIKKVGIIESFEDSIAWYEG